MSQQDPTGLVIPVDFELRIEEGLEELSDEAIGEIQQEARVIIEESGMAMEETARELVPVRTGRLLQSIFHEVIDIIGLVLGARTPYAAFVEYGTSKMASQPYLEPAIAAHEPMLQARLDQMVLEIVERDLADKQEAADEEAVLELETEAVWQ